MLSLVEKAVNYFTGNRDLSTSMATETERPNLKDFVSLQESETETYSFEGRVTSVSKSCIVIAHDIYCDPVEFPAVRSVGLGAYMRGVAERKGRHEAWRVTQAELIQEEWDIDQTSNYQYILDERKVDYFTSDSGITPCHHIAKEIPGINLSKIIPTPIAEKTLPEKLRATSVRKQIVTVQPEDKNTIMGQVSRLASDTVTISDNVSFHLCPFSCDFELLEGDWVICKIDEAELIEESNVKLNGGFLRASSVRALRRKRVEGEVTHQYSTHSIINHEIYCPWSLASAAGVKSKDQVWAEVIESEQEQLQWRAVSVTPIPSVPSLQDLLHVAPSLSCVYGSTSLEVGSQEQNVIISPDLRFPEVHLGSSAVLEVSVIICGNETRMLQRVFIPWVQEVQFTVKEVKYGLPQVLHPGKKISVKFECKGKLIGEARGVCIFDFSDFHIIRYISAYITDPHMSDLGPVSPHVPLTYQNLPRSQKQGTTGVILGEKPFQPPIFPPISLPVACVPEHLWVAADRGKEEILNVAPVLADPLTVDNHRERFTSLLHLEEIELTHQIRQFDMPRTVFESYGDYLSLIVPSLAEHRPSLMVGDTVEAYPPHDSEAYPTQDTVYQGYIHQVLQSKVLLKFHPGFHSQYCGEDYAVHFNINRTPLRRCHFALKFAMSQLGPDTLFPTKLKFQPPQVCYVDSEASLPCKLRKDIKCIIAKKSPKNELKETSNEKKILNMDHADNSVYSDTLELEPLRYHQNCEDNLTRKPSSVPEMNNTLGIYQNYGKNHVEKDVVIEKIHKERRSQRKSDFSSISDNHGKVLTGTHVQEESYKHPLQRSKQNLASQRIPVVTRLFGVQSSGSCASSLVNCSDEETKRSTNQTSVLVTPTLKISNEKRLKRASSEVGHSPVDASKSKIPVSNLTTSECNVKKEGCGNSADDILSKQIMTEKQISTPHVEVTDSKKGTLINHCSDKCSTDAGTPQNVNLNGTKLFIPRCLEIAYYKNAAAKEVECKNKLATTASAKEKVKTEQEHKKHGDGRPGNNVWIWSHVSEGQKKESKIRYIIPHLPLHPNSERAYKSRLSLPVLTFINKTLNREQKLAVRRILQGTTRPLPYVIFGPPGTGKTVTLVEATLQILALMPASRILIVTPSNSASDLVAERLVISGKLGPTDLLRLNAYQRSEESIPLSLRPFSRTGDGLDSGAVMRRVTCVTATTAGVLYTRGLHSGHYTHILVDEAGQLTEPETLLVIGLVNRKSGQIVLCGDPRQLGPVVISRLAHSYGLQQSLLHRLCQSVLYQPQEVEGGWWYEPSLVTQLVHNYRSHPDILAVPSTLFYNNTLLPSADMKPLEYLLAWDKLPRPGFPLFFHGILGQNMQEGDSPSWFNPAEAFQAVRYAQSLITYGVCPKHIGVITPYRKQGEKIMKLLCTFGVSTDVKVGSVEEFQGQERQVILISTVKSSVDLPQCDMERYLGFVQCPRRFNVAVTRAQGLLVMLGDPFLLSHDHSWNQMITFCITQGAYRGPDVQAILQNHSFSSS